MVLLSVGPAPGMGYGRKGDLLTPGQPKRVDQGEALLPDTGCIPNFKSVIIVGSTIFSGTC